MASIDDVNAIRIVKHGLSCTNRLMAKETWKEFEDNLITHSAAHYLMTIHHLLADNGYARVTDIAKRLNITRGSCSISLKPLKRRGLVVEDENRFLRLSESGKRIAEMVELNDELLEFLFRDILGVSEEQAEIDACKIEHLLSIETSMALANFVKTWKAGGKGVQLIAKELAAKSAECKHDATSCDVCRTTCIVDIVPKEA